MSCIVIFITSVLAHTGPILNGWVDLIEGVQMSDCEVDPLRPLAPFVKIDASGKPYLEGLKCTACGEVLAVGGRRACPKCAAIGALVPIRLAERGRLYTYTVVHRSMPGVATPFVAALVDLDGGGAIKGNLIGLESDAIRFDMPVQVQFETLIAAGEKTARHVRHYFTAAAGGCEAKG
jgi:uncharacterized OB-fold protein